MTQCRTRFWRDDVKGPLHVHCKHKIKQILITSIEVQIQY